MQLTHHHPRHVGHAAGDPGDVGVRAQDQAPHADRAPAVARRAVPGQSGRLPGDLGCGAQGRGQELKGEPLTGPGAAREGDPLAGGGAHQLRAQLHNKRP